MDSESCPNVSARLVLRYVDEIKSKSGCERAIVAIDYLQVWPIASTQNLRSDLEADKWRIGEIKKIRDSLNDDPVLVISEARKPSGNNLGWGTDLSDVMGSARGSYTPDAVLLITPTTLEELAFAINPKNSNEAKDQAGKKLKALEDSGSCLISLKLVKGRDGMDRFKEILLFEYKKNVFNKFM